MEAEKESHVVAENGEAEVEDKMKEVSLSSFCSTLLFP